MATDFTKIATHPEIKTIISKLVSGESSKLVSNYLKDKYPKPDEGHLRIPATQLQEFLDSYADHNGYVKKIVQRDTDSKLDKKIAESLMDTAPWKERVLEGVEKEINYIDKLNAVVTILEKRAEQLFDLIQSDPENTRTDYVFTKYMEQLMIAIEKADKIKNDKPDIRVEHTYTLQMVEQQTVAFQEAIGRVLERMGPEYTSIFMDILAEEMNKLRAKDIYKIPEARNIDKETKSLDMFEHDVQEMDSKLLEEGVFDDDEDE
jgi:hypothetical protein